MTRRKTIMLLVTYGCNLRCTYCYEPKQFHYKMSVSDAKKFITLQMDKLDDSYDDLEVQFMGGEPLMVFPFIKEVSEWLWQQKFPIPLAHVFIPTNGTLLTYEMKEWFSFHKEKICLGLSFDGNRLMQNINRSYSSDNVDLAYFAKTWPRQSVKMTLSPETIESLFDGVMFLYEQGLHYVTIDLAMGAHIKWEQKHLDVFTQQLQSMANYHICHPDYPRISLLDIDILAPLHHNNRTKNCSCGEQLVCIDVDGTEYACHIFSPITASKAKAEVSRRIDFSKHKDFTSDLCRSCILSPLCTHCYGMNFNITGDVKTQSAFTCKTFKIQFLISCDMHIRLAEKQKDLNRIHQIKQLILQFQKNNNGNYHFRNPSIN